MISGSFSRSLTWQPTEAFLNTLELVLLTTGHPQFMLSICPDKPQLPAAEAIKSEYLPVLILRGPRLALTLFFTTGILSEPHPTVFNAFYLIAMRFKLRAAIRPRLKHCPKYSAFVLYCEVSQAASAIRSGIRVQGRGH